MVGPKITYHHGNLRAALIRAALEMLDDGNVTDLSLRAAARHAGVSTGAPYRHFADRDALLSAVAAVGYRQLVQAMIAVQPEPRTAADLADIAVAYVQFALTRPGLFQVMFAEGCDRSDPDRVAAGDAVRDYLKDIVVQLFPSAESETLATAMWAVMHGLAFLHLDGKIDSSDPVDVAARIRSSLSALSGVAVSHD